MAAVAYAKKGEYDKAIDEFTKAILIDPALARAYYNRGTTYFNKGESDQALLSSP